MPSPTICCLDLGLGPPHPTPGGAGGRGRWVTQGTALPALWLAACRKARPAWAPLSLLV